jgi:hypothetical protein
MKGLTPALTVGSLRMALDMMPSTSNVFIMPDESDGYRIGGILQVHDDKGQPQCWLLLEDDIAEYESRTGGADNEDDENGSVVLDLSDLGVGAPTEPPKEPEDVVKVRGLLKSA